MTSISAGERRAKGRNKGEMKRGDVLYTVQTWWEGGAVGEEGDFFSLPRGGFFFGSSPYLDDSESVPQRQNMQVNTLDQKDAPSQMSEGRGGQCLSRRARSACFRVRF